MLPNSAPNATDCQARKLKSRNKPSSCPWCGSNRIAIVLAGMPVFIPELEGELDRGAMAFVGHDKGQRGAAWQCTECGAQFFRDNSPRILPQ
jgi:predicted RNA-binding Zn-ribbon protein involved in translation (DUF1610 family)